MIWGEIDRIDPIRGIAPFQGIEAIQSYRRPGPGHRIDVKLPTVARALPVLGDNAALRVIVYDRTKEIPSPSSEEGMYGDEPERQRPRRFFRWGFPPEPV